MYRSLFALVVLTPLVAAAPVPKKEEPKLYFPTVVGAKRVHVSTFGQNAPRVEVAETVLKVDERDGVYTVTVASDDRPDKAQPDVFEVSEKGVFLVSAAGTKLTTPGPLFKQTAKAGETWEVTTETDTPAGKFSYTTTFTMGKEEEIEAGGVKYKAVKVTGAFEAQPGVRQTIDQWFAVGVGRVKWETSVPTANVKATTELTAFTIGKDDKAKPGK